MNVVWLADFGTMGSNAGQSQVIPPLSMCDSANSAYGLAVSNLKHKQVDHKKCVSACMQWGLKIAK